MGRQRAVITVFFSLLSVIFLAGAFTVVEAVRVAGARAHCANASVLGLWSVFSEYENLLLEDYGLFAVDGGSGGGSVSKENLQSRYSGYLRENESGTADMSGKLQGILLDPWKVSVSQAQVNQYALLTDHAGDYYYQQAVEYMRQTAWSGAIGKLKAMYSNSEEIRQAESEFEQSRKESGKNAGELEQELRDARNQLSGSQGSGGNGTAGGSSGVASSGSIEIIAVGEDAEKLRQAEEEARKKNPLEKIASLQKEELLVLVCGRGNVSDKALDSGALLSKRKRNIGVLDLDTPHGGEIDDLLFREYLLDHFPDCSDKDTEKALSYQLEYMIAGKHTDAANLKKVLKRLLFLREGMNYSFLLSSSSCNLQVSALASLIAGWTGKPLLVAGIKHALLLAWAYGESLFDVRILLHGGRIPLKKDESSWNVPLEGLIDLETDLPRADRIAKSGSVGLCYKDFLRILLAMTRVPTLRLRSLDMLEQNIRMSEGMGAFRADNCVVGMTVRTDWDIHPVFSNVPSALIGINVPAFRTSVKGGFAY